MIGQMNIYGMDKVQTAIKRLQTFEPPEGYYLAFSGGKDSVVIKALADMAGVKYDAHYNVTSVDPPELVQFIKTYHSDVNFEKQYYKDGTPITMWNLIPRQGMPPTQIARYCCKYLKEGSGHNRFVITGVRQAESTKRRSRGGVEIQGKTRAESQSFDPDNPGQALTHLCVAKRKKILNPIIDWTTDDVWEFIKMHNIPYCKLYDEGFHRLGCIGCLYGNKVERKHGFERWPKYKNNYLKAFERMLKADKEKGKKHDWQTADDVMRWWLMEDTKTDEDEENE